MGCAYESVLASLGRTGELCESVLVSLGRADELFSKSRGSSFSIDAETLVCNALTDWNVKKGDNATRFSYTTVRSIADL
ncbi:uncharacterized protein PITG_09085 [Phytophthora infestans T30-4]|uniref:Uncharacterized protein n=1 Tax=Phytophthora infestans (strain T30-4) TaxID=403677 RepID=D0NBN6_PHYIT|nr:uncharacterized protein PITG_09085 [Phytophthora infestans T30-4]EEY55191.1 hypothetical protein PITG_09085 [Phytophthora infestans T30-4]|eukprot:XP_002903415.1 hypothetical protein PITG_09085 [Phytophthora infestans T30-4]